MADEWRTIEHPGYLGKARDAVHRMWDDTYGADNWRLAYCWGDRVIERKEALQIYEDGYFEFFRREPDLLRWLSGFADVYDTAKSNVAAGFSYDVQETPNNHIHDVAIRRAMMRHGAEFTGTNLLHVRWTGSEGLPLNPGVVAFHRPDLIVQREIKDYSGAGIWWHPGTIEDFYQRNKLLQVRSA